MKTLFKIYRFLISPVLHAFSRACGGEPNAGCRFEPSCSEYAEKALGIYGVKKGLWKSIKRLARCQPFSGPGGFDPV